MARKAILLGLLCLPTGLAASALPDSAANDVPVIIYRPAFGETQITARLNPGLCVAFSVPDEWRRDDAAAGGLRLVSSTGEGEIEIASRSIRDLNDLPQGNVSARDAALLQRDHEEILGRKAQASAVETMERRNPLDRDLDRHQPSGAVPQPHGRDLHRARIARMAVGSVRDRYRQPRRL